MNTDLILVLDFGGNQAYYTARRLRGEQFYCEILPGDTHPAEIIARRPLGIVLAGGESDQAPAQPLPFDPEIFCVPVLAFGAAARMLAESVGAQYNGTQTKNGIDSVQFSICDLFEGLSENDRFIERVDQYALPEGFSPIATTHSGLMPGFACLPKHIYGLQFYVESNDPDGLQILQNFAQRICGAPRDWRVENFAPLLIEQMRETIGNGNVLIPVSGGVDTAVAAAVLHRAIGNRLTCVFIDTGLLRKGEAELVRRAFYDKMGMNLLFTEEQNRFIKALKGVSDAHEKRRIMHDEFSALFAEQYVKSGNYDHMAEGTIYPDVLHNVPRLSGNMIDGCKLIEPLRLLFKEDVRALGCYLEVPDELISRPSFESSGLSVRCLGEVTEEKLCMLREADAIFNEEVEKAALTRRIAQFFAILTDLKTPGLHGSGYVCVLRALGSSNAGKAPAFKLPYDLMDVVVQRITSEVHGITHVVYDITGRPIAAVEWE